MGNGLTNRLDNQADINQIDSGNSFSSVRLLSNQISQTWQEISLFPLIVSAPVSSVYFCAMGGSAYAGRIIKSLFYNSLKIPVEIVDSYQLPQSVNKGSLIICASYSGDTEETISCCRQALSKNLPLIGVSQGGQLTRLLKQNRKPVFNFTQKFNPSRQPRLGQGYMIVSQLGILSKLRLIDLDDDDMDKIVVFLNKRNTQLDVKMAVSSNQAKKLAIIFSDKIVNLIASEFLSGSLHAIRNPLNETGKHFANYFVLPELNHHLLEGLEYPEILRPNALFAFIDTPFYSSPVKKRMAITREVLGKIGLKYLTVNLRGESLLEEVFELLQLFSFVSFYLAVLHRVNPTPVPWVDYFKKRLSAKG
ncbi:hypothetical protein A3D78_01610 [Candidatus Gottesmanbacteria bacterium RIFCSPHIGHO2_02_FULL_39_14]|uniref:SIS domain-containing protein n=3 Tax=Candidatus Gottesmaniibacteriota TaxID=1752720 RepID=A0A1F5ZXY4_9BACT|nr:MAG: hypothetical protein A2153_05350 [Candidatus Gottesmanbacteria bacterium RBG_16_38_7b]OGG17339.1 MAG: hypothetical protein A3D78_01610 [Candidatus Gottesmanbacteria bacterium RIFCSPHIGHO2_02_FULL_39_14]OGG32350.1 MAG: hypothetical protein A3I51_03045 [Candidatus Gottesmanbacteria bacterium RIFCSPLOWO2_02_FULL_38_8]